MDKMQIEQWKLKKMLKWLNWLQGENTCLISLFIPGNENLNLINKLLISEFSTATNIKSKKNRLAVQDAIKSIQFRLKNTKLSKNGIVIYSGTIDDKLLTFNIEPILPILSKKYICNNRFLIEPLYESLNLFDDVYAFIIISGNETRVFTLKGNHIKKIYDFDVNLTNKTRRGGSSAGRISRSIEENHTNYLKIINENIYRLLVKENKLIVNGIILSGPGDLKNKYLDSTFCDKIIKNGVLKIINSDKIEVCDILELSKDILSNQKIMKEKTIINQFFEHIRICDNLIVFTEKETIELFNDGVIKTLIIYENYSSELIDYFIENNSNNSDIFLISDSSIEGNSFVKDYNGIGGILHYPIIRYTDEYEN